MTLEITIDTKNCYFYRAAVNFVALALRAESSLKNSLDKYLYYLSYTSVQVLSLGSYYISNTVFEHVNSGNILCLFTRKIIYIWHNLFTVVKSNTIFLSEFVFKKRNRLSIWKQTFFIHFIDYLKFSITYFKLYHDL